MRFAIFAAAVALPLLCAGPSMAYDDAWQRQEDARQHRYYQEQFNQDMDDAYDRLHKQQAEDEARNREWERRFKADHERHEQELFGHPSSKTTCVFCEKEEDE